MKNFVEIGKKIVAVGPNYAPHSVELNFEIPKVPLAFLKPSSAFITEGNTIRRPEGCTDMHEEVELGIVIGRRASRISEAQAMDYVAGYALALDMTARDWQLDAMSTRKPWLFSKGFDTSCPVSRFISKEEVPNPYNLDMWCSVNGKIRQQCNTKEMIFSIPFILYNVTRYVTLEPGDLVITGTPGGASTVVSGDNIECGLSDLVKMTFCVE